MTSKRVLTGISMLSILATLAACGGGGGGTPAPGTDPGPGPGPGSGTGPSTGTALTGKLIGPVGATAVLTNNGGDDLSVTITSTLAGNPPYEVKAFTFATGQATGANYLVAV